MVYRAARFTRMALVVLAAWMVCGALPAFAQAPDESSPLSVGSIFKQVVSDPTTYTPSIVTAGGQYLDWKSSQVFFDHGFLEQNPTFTTSGRENDAAVGYGTGNWRIARSAVVNLGPSLVNNAATAIIERALIKRYPTHRKLVRVLSWTERIAFASYASYNRSAASYRQWELNRERARQLGY